MNEMTPIPRGNLAEAIENMFEKSEKQIVFTVGNSISIVRFLFDDNDYDDVSCCLLDTHRKIFFFFLAMRILFKQVFYS